jgi:hypothetical protein
VKRAVKWAAATGGWLLVIVKKAASGRFGPVSGAAATRGDRADLRVAGPLPPVEQGLQAATAQQRNDDPPCHDQPDRPPTRTRIADFLNTLLGVERPLIDMQVDNIHLDLGLPFPDASLGTGAGSISEDGELLCSYPILADRTLHKRTYKLCLFHDAYFMPHIASRIEMSYGSFTTAGITGKQKEPQ